MCLRSERIALRGFHPCARLHGNVSNSLQLNTTIEEDTCSEMYNIYFNPESY